MTRRAIGARLLVVAATLAAAAIGLHVLGAAGYRYGPVGVTLGLAGATGLLCYLLLRSAPRVGLVTGAIMLVAVAVASLLVERAPLSKGALATRMDALDLPFFEVVEERTSGHSWCRPTCPVVSRTYRGPNIGPEPAILAVGSALASEDVIPLERLGTIRSQRSVTIATERFVVSAAIGDVVDQGRLVTVSYRAVRPGG